MSERKRKTKEPCPICGLHKARCLCHLLKPLTLKTRVILVIHAKELKRTTNTGQLAVHALTNSQLFVRGREGDPLELQGLVTDEYETLLLYPSLDAELLDEELVRRLKRPVQLIVPDGNWRQAGKVHLRHPELAHIRRVKLKRSLPAKFHLRRESTEAGMATLEAIAEALHILEGDHASGPLRALYCEKLARTLAGRGVLPG